MKQLITIVLVCAISIQAGFALNNDNFKDGQITGQVIDDALDAPLPYVNVVVKNVQGEIVTGGITDEDGNFKIEKIPEGKYTVTIQYIGFKDENREVDISRRNSRIKLGEIRLVESAEGLDEVTVVAEVSTIQQKVDRKVINVGKDLTTSGPTASDIMNNLPSVSVDQQTGDISLRGNQNVQVMVDGKLSNIPAAQLLRQIPSTSIKQIELITNPSAKYNPEGMSGIINIILHKNINIGFNGNLNVGLSYQIEPKFNSSIDMNYRNGKLNFYGSYGNNIAGNDNYGNVVRVDEDSDQQFKFLDESQSHLFKVGVDFYLNEKNTISVFTNQNLFDGNSTGRTDIVFFNNPSSNNGQNFENVRDNLSSQYNFNYKLDFDKEGHNIELEADFNDFESEEDADFRFFGASTIDPYMDFVDTERHRTTINLDYVNPITENAKFEAGLQALLFNTDIGYSSTGESFNVEGELRPTPSTVFDYVRDIYSAYATYSNKKDKWSYQIGARVETVMEDALATNIESDGETTLIPFENDYVSVYPSTFLTYSPSEKNSYQISYSRRVDRPGVGQVNPIREWATPLITSFGNQSLEPQFTNSIELNYTRQMEKGSITAGVFYRIIQDEINRALFVDRNDLNRLILTFDNFDDTSAYGIELSSNYRPTKWWSINGSFDLYSQTQKGISETLSVPTDQATIDDIETEIIEVDNVAWNLRMFNNFKVSNNLSFSLFALYRGQNRNIQFEVDPMAMVNIGMRYSFIDGKATFSLNYNDIFDTMNFGFNGDRPFRQVGQFNWESQTVFAGLSYRFGGGKYRAKSRKQRDRNEKQGSGGIF